MIPFLQSGCNATFVYQIYWYIKWLLSSQFEDVVYDANDSKRGPDALLRLGNFQVTALTEAIETQEHFWIDT